MFLPFFSSTENLTRLLRPDQNQLRAFRLLVMAENQLHRDSSTCNRSVDENLIAAILGALMHSRSSVAFEGRVSGLSSSS